MKQTTEVSGHQTPEACSSLSGVSTGQAHVSFIPAWYQVYVRPCRTTRNFLAVLCRFWHSVSTRKIYRQLQGYSKFGRYSLHLGIFFQTVNFKTSKFFVSKSKMPTYICEYMESEKVQGHPIAIIREDNAGENKELVTLAHSKDWKHETIFENMARKTPQQNSYAELAFMVLVAKARAMLSAAHVPKDKRHKLWGETVMTATALDNLIPVT